MRLDIERELEIAISQFAPGSEIVQDKRVHTACGVADLIPGREGCSVGLLSPFSLLRRPADFVYVDGGTRP
jgi:hypothetical protein